MAEVFLKLDQIPGESKDEKGHADEIEVLSYSWGCSQLGSFSGGGGGGTGGVQNQNISFTFVTSKATPKLAEKCIDGTHIATAKLTLRKAGGTALEYLVYEFKDLMVTSYQTGAGGNDTVIDTFSFDFAAMKAKYKEQKADGSGVDAGEYQWNFKTNAASF